MRLGRDSLVWRSIYRASRSSRDFSSLSLDRSVICSRYRSSVLLSSLLVHSPATSHRLSKLQRNWEDQSQNFADLVEGSANHTSRFFRGIGTIILLAVSSLSIAAILGLAVVGAAMLL